MRILIQLITIMRLMIDLLMMTILRLEVKHSQMTLALMWSKDASYSAKE